MALSLLSIWSRLSAPGSVYRELVPDAGLWLLVLCCGNDEAN